jgi:hypothetical protein
MSDVGFEDKSLLVKRRGAKRDAGWNLQGLDYVF